MMSSARAAPATLRPLEVFLGKFTQNRNEPLGIVHVSRRDIDRQGYAVLLKGLPDLHVSSFLSAVDAALEAPGREVAGSAIDDQSTRLGSITPMRRETFLVDGRQSP